MRPKHPVVIRLERPHKRMSYLSSSHDTSQEADSWVEEQRHRYASDDSVTLTVFREANALPYIMGELREPKKVIQ